MMTRMTTGSKEPHHIGSHTLSSWPRVHPNYIIALRRRVRSTARKFGQVDTGDSLGAFGSGTLYSWPSVNGKYRESAQLHDILVIEYCQRRKPFKIVILFLQFALRKVLAKTFGMS